MAKGNTRKKRVLIAVLTISAVVGLLGGILFAVLLQAAKSTGIGSGEVADYETRIEIWENAAGNSDASKLDDMDIDYNANLMFSALRFVSAIVNENYADSERVIDTFTYHYEIKSGYESENYDDEPYLIPYLVEGSDTAVIVIPGGGFGYKSMDGSTGESKDIAQTPNESGISAFVLHYRTNPYEYPTPYLDVQRAVRYLRYHSEEYQIDPDKISLIGFSAGGNEIGTFINVIQGNNYFPEDYIPDEIDAVNDHVSSAAMIYPALSFRYNVPMLFAMFDSEEVKDTDTREELLRMTDLCEQIFSEDVRQFIAYGTKDKMVGTEETQKYISSAGNAGCEITVVEAEGQDHGFSQEYYMEQYLEWLKK